ncbi:phosphatidate phosphatase PAH1 isoform X2 [Physcomitrium patens]|uniref:LNS2/PITP domain-containing protein n=1 Tax=Physcomitrium patens TaxID=3218 RepID=A0A7I4A8I5_PHYPA|nr:phosphatidate phosphatase PAH1-like isoform X2 [Physcomitrium patens]|eukprot:XP_024388319.1 phosphatidate phosphatase PAH1-like isoform X2 [Physcomitrella patens]
MFRLSLARRSNMYNTVGRLISQGVYTVAGPFHPFGGAVDIIVVQQQDGSYKSSPWYVKFGKFQGVLKRSEKVVNIAVNDVNVKFHMYLDSTGEAYFLKDAEPEKEPSPSQLAITAGDEVLAIEDAPSKLEDGSESKEEFADAKEEAEEAESSDEKDSNLELRFEGRKASYLLVQQSRAAEEAKQFTEPSESSSFKEDTDITRKNELLEKSTSEGDAHITGKDEIPESSTLTHDLDVAGAIEYLEISTLKKDTEALGDAEFSESISLKEDSVDFIVDTETLDSNAFKEESRTIGEPSDVLLSSLATLKLRSNFETSIEELENATGGSVVNAFLKQAVGLEVSQQAGRPSTSLVAQAALASVAKAAWESGGEGLSNSLGTGARDSFEVFNNRGEVVAEGFRMRKSKSLNMGSRSSADEPVRVRRVKSESDLRLLNTDGRRMKGESGLGPNNIEDNSPELSTLTIASADGVVVLHTPRRGSPPPLPSQDDQIQQQPIMYEADGFEKPLVLGMLSFDNVVSDEAQGDNQVEKTDPSPVKKEVNALISTAGSGWKLWPFPLRRPRTPETNGSRPIISSQALLVAQNAAVNTAIVNNLIPDKDYYRSRKNKVRSFLPTSQMLAEMNLKEGSNRITFTFLTRVLGSQQVDARIYLWKWNTRVVISDVDGTITKSDVLGQVMPLVGRDWTQSGVTRLFSAIKENGYEVMFLSARAISQAYLTRQFLLNLKQDGEALPDGPVVISPDGLFPSLYREVIRRAPHEFKIACLQDIRDLFPKDCNPFYAGFGNRETDEISYLKVGIPKGKVFIINPKGEVAVNNRVDVKSYTSLHKLVDDMFPPQTYTEQEDFNSWNYWKMPLPDIEDELSVKSGSKPKKTK